MTLSGKMTVNLDTMLDELTLDTAPLRQLATIVRGADTARLELAPQAAGLLAVSLGYSRMFRDDLEQLAADRQRGAGDSVKKTRPARL